jgi:hypothetical protein
LSPGKLFFHNRNFSLLHFSHFYIFYEDVLKFFLVLLDKGIVCIVRKNNEESVKNSSRK